MHTPRPAPFHSHPYHHPQAVPPVQLLCCFANSGGTAWKRLNLLLCALIYLGVFTAVGLLYRFVPMGGCSFNPAALTVTAENTRTAEIDSHGRNRLARLK